MPGPKENNLYQNTILERMMSGRNKKESIPVAWNASFPDLFKSVAAVPAVILKVLEEGQWWWRTTLILATGRQRKGLL